MGFRLYAAGALAVVGGLVVSFGYAAYKPGGIGAVLAYLPYWAGLTMGVSERWLAKGA